MFYDKYRKSPDKPKEFSAIQSLVLDGYTNWSRKNNDEEKKVAEKLITLLKAKGYHVVTTVEKAGKFWEAESYHQDYYNKNGHQPYCHIYQKRF